MTFQCSSVCPCPAVPPNFQLGPSDISLGTALCPCPVMFLKDSMLHCACCLDIKASCLSSNVLLCVHVQQFRPIFNWDPQTSVWVLPSVHVAVVHVAVVHVVHDVVCLWLEVGVTLWFHQGFCPMRVPPNFQLGPSDICLGTSRYSQSVFILSPP